MLCSSTTACHKNEVFPLLLLCNIPRDCENGYPITPLCNEHVELSNPLPSEMTCHSFTSWSILASRHMLAPSRWGSPTSYRVSGDVTTCFMLRLVGKTMSREDYRLLGARDGVVAPRVTAVADIHLPGLLGLCGFVDSSTDKGHYVDDKDCYFVLRSCESIILSMMSYSS